MPGPLLTEQKRRKTMHGNDRSQIGARSEQRIDGGVKWLVKVKRLNTPRALGRRHYITRHGRIFGKGRDQVVRVGRAIGVNQKP